MYLDNLPSTMPLKLNNIEEKPESGIELDTPIVRIIKITKQILVIRKYHSQNSKNMNAHTNFNAKSRRGHHYRRPLYNRYLKFGQLLGYAAINNDDMIFIFVVVVCIKKCYFS